MFAIRFKGTDKGRYRTFPMLFQMMVIISSKTLVV